MLLSRTIHLKSQPNILVVRESQLGRGGYLWFTPLNPENSPGAWLTESDGSKPGTMVGVLWGPDSFLFGNDSLSKIHQKSSKSLMDSHSLRYSIESSFRHCLEGQNCTGTEIPADDSADELPDGCTRPRAHRPEPVHPPVRTLRANMQQQGRE